MAEEQYAAYNYEFGYPPKKPSHLLAFAKKNGAKVSWGEAKALIKKAPDTSDYVPPPKKDVTGQIINRPKAKRKNTEEKKSEKIEIAKRYSTNELVIDPQQLFSKRSSSTKYQYLVSQLTSMGWDKDQSLAAIKASNGNLQLALESLMSGEINKPMITMNRTKNQQCQSPKKGSTKTAAPKLKTKELQTFLNNMALGEYYRNFVNYGFGDDLSGLYTVDENMLKQMGISLMAHRKTILKQIYGADYAKQQTQKQQQPMTPTVDLDDAFEKLLGGHGSIKHRLRAMDEIYANLDYMNISTDNGKVLLSAYAEQILHEDYIYREYNVRIKGIRQIADIFLYCLNKLKGDQIVLLIENSLPEILDNLFLLLDNNRAMKFHDMCRQCINKIVTAVINKHNKVATISLCGFLNEKVNIECVTQAHVRFFAAKLIFQHIIFNSHVAFVNNMFNIDINKYDNKLQQYRNGINNVEVPGNDCREWFDLLIANAWNDNDDETFKDIITDCLSILSIDPNCDICTVASNLLVYFSSFNGNFANSLEREAKYRFNKYLLVKPDGNVMSHTPQPLKAVTQTAKQPVQTQNAYQHNGEVDYRIKQETAVNVAAPTLPSI